MCGIIAVDWNDNVDKESLAILADTLRESEIRGLHASGISYWTIEKGIKTIKQPGSMTKLLKSINLSDLVDPDTNSLKLIAHVRYSTSDLMYNQPVVSKYSSLVHNGVITQEDPDKWEDDFGYVCEGRNDTELLLHLLDAGGNIASEFPLASYAFARLDNDGNLTVRRNGQRPLWSARLSHNDNIIYASTRDILFRAGVLDEQTLLTPDDDSKETNDITTRKNESVYNILQEQH